MFISTLIHRHAKAAHLNLVRLGKGSVHRSSRIQMVRSNGSNLRRTALKYCHAKAAHLFLVRVRKGSVHQAGQIQKVLSNVSNLRRTTLRYSLPAGLCLRRNFLYFSLYTFPFFWSSLLARDYLSDSWCLCIETFFQGNVNICQTAETSVRSLLNTNLVSHCA